MKISHYFHQHRLLYFILYTLFSTHNFIYLVFTDVSQQIDDDLNLEREKTYLAALPEGATKLPNDLYKDPNASLTPGWDEDDEDLLVETDEEKLKKRTKEILQTVCTASTIAHSYSHLTNMNECNTNISALDEINF